MSGNPFRRSPGASGQTLNPGPASSETVPIPLSLDTGVRPQITNDTIKHVSFRSPPALPLSPDSPTVSYPPSPISARIYPDSARASSASTPTTAHGEVYPDNPFDGESSGEEENGALDEARQNARTNLQSAVQKGPSPAKPQDSVQTALGMIVSRPKGSPGRQIADNDAGRESMTKATMDVDAFKRMLLKGGSASQGAGESALSQGPSVQPPSTSESSSSADTASISRQSIFEPMPPIPAESPRTSQELDDEEAEDERRLVIKEGAEVKRKPLPPKPRHGKLIKHNIPTAAPLPTQELQNVRSESPMPINPAAQDKSDLNKPLPLPPIDSTFPDINRQTSEQDSKPADATKRPPPPPQARRRNSQRQSAKPTLSSSSSSRQSYIMDPQIPQRSTTVSVSSTAPGPPLFRRSTGPGHFDRRPSADAASGVEEQEQQLFTPLSPSTSSTPRPPLPPSRRSSSAKLSPQPSPGLPPPLPPPRRARGTSKNSFDMSRPAFAMTPMAPMERRGGAEPSTDSSRNVSGASNTSDLLADLAALQREVDAIRAKGAMADA